MTAAELLGWLSAALLLQLAVGVGMLARRREPAAPMPSARPGVEPLRWHELLACHGCHEHKEAKVRAEHLDEGIRDFRNCVECHRYPRVGPE